MTWGDGAAYAGFEEAKDRVVSSDLPLLEKLRRITAINAAGARSAPGGTVGTLLSTAIGAALGLGVAKGVGSLMGLSDDSQDKINMAGAAFGGFMGLRKQAEVDRVNAFRLGFMKAAKASGYFKKVAFNPLGLIIDPIAGASQAARAVGAVGGSGLAMLDSYDDTDEDIMRMQVESALLKQQLAKMDAEKKSKLIKRILDSRSAVV